MFFDLAVGDRLRSLIFAFSAVFLCALWLPAQAHRVYIMNDNHTDYNWNATAAEYDAAMLGEVDYYLDQFDATQGNPVDEQSRYTADNWWYVYLYERNRSPEEFERLMSRVRSGHFTVPVNPLVPLYGAMSTEMTIRAGYYPGRIGREFNVEFPLAYPSVENGTMPWGLASIFAGSGARYAWKGVCGCVHTSPHEDVPAELFWWAGQDDRRLLTKWYRLKSGHSDRGGYAEARFNLTNAELQEEIQQTQQDMPGISATGLFGRGWDDLEYQSTEIVDTVIAFNQQNGPDQAIVSNGSDFFQDLEASGEAATLPVLRGGFGNDWDMWPITTAERTARQRRAIERLRLAEFLSVLAELGEPGSWSASQATIEAALTSTWKYFDHGWDVTPSGPTLARMNADKETWTADIENAVAAVVGDASTKVAPLFTSGAQDRVVVFNALGFERSDVVDLEVPHTGPWRIVDIESGQAVPSQLQTLSGVLHVRWLASDVPSLGFRQYRLEPAAPPNLAAAASVNTGTRVIESGEYRVTVGTRGQLTSVVYKPTGREMAGALGLGDDPDSGDNVNSVSAENVGPVSATLKLQLLAPLREVRVTLFADAIERIELDIEVLENATGYRAYLFDVSTASPDIRFEEVGAIARPGLISEGGDFLPGTRADRLTINHFVSFGSNDHSLVVSNADAFAMRVGQSTDRVFDLGGSNVEVIVSDWPLGTGLDDQGGDDYFLHRFALSAMAGSVTPASAMRYSQAHQNRLYPVRVPHNSTGPLTANVHSLLSFDASNVVVTAFKPAEDTGAGVVVRGWELGGQATDARITTSLMASGRAFRTNLIETDQEEVAVDGNGLITANLTAFEIGTWRFGAAIVSSLPGSGGSAASGSGSGGSSISVPVFAAFALLWLIGLGVRRRVCKARG